jgi:hypothetical protein
MVLKDINTYLGLIIELTYFLTRQSQYKDFVVGQVNF